MSGWRLRPFTGGWIAGLRHKERHKLGLDSRVEFRPNCSPRGVSERLSFPRSGQIDSKAGKWQLRGLKNRFDVLSDARREPVKLIDCLDHVLLAHFVE
jgi:hypothetical protein